MDRNAFYNVIVIRTIVYPWLWNSIANETTNKHLREFFGSYQLLSFDTGDRVVNLFAGYFCRWLAKQYHITEKHLRRLRQYVMISWNV